MLPGLIQVVEIEVGVPQGVDEFPRRFEIADLGDHHGQEGVGGDVEGNSQERHLRCVDKAGRRGRPSLDVKLHEGVTGGQGHFDPIQRGSMR